MNQGGDLGYARVGEEVTTQEAGSEVRRHKSIRGRAQYARCVEEETQRRGVRRVGWGVEVGSRCGRVTFLYIRRGGAIHGGGEGRWQGQTALP